MRADRPVPDFAPELKIVSSSPSEDLQLSMPADASRFPRRHLCDSLACFSCPNRHHRLPTHYSSKQLFGQGVSGLVRQIEIIDQLATESAVDNHRVSIISA